jgi:hypothetical protein
MLHRRAVLFFQKMSNLDFLELDPDVFTSPVHTPALSTSYDWSEWLSSSAAGVPTSLTPLCSPLPDFGMDSFDFKDDMPTLVATKGGNSPDVSQIPMPKVQVRSRPCVFKPFTSLESVEIIVQQLKAIIRRNHRGTMPPTGWPL